MVPAVVPVVVCQSQRLINGFASERKREAPGDVKAMLCCCISSF